MSYDIITIAREHGSGGRGIAQMVAKQLNIPFYDKELIQLAAKNSGLSQEFIAQSEQKLTHSFLYDLYTSSINPSISDQVFLAQSQVILELAQKGPCVLVGRCADYVLRDKAKCLNVFIYAPMEERMKRVQEYVDTPLKSPRAYVEKCDKNRASYYNYFAEPSWGDRKLYHLMINSTIGLQKAADLICQAVLEKEDNQ